MKRKTSNSRVLPLKRNLLAAAIRHGLSAGGAAMTLSLAPIVMAQGLFGEAIELSDLDGVIGIAINAVDSSSGAGSLVSGAGDINGDGVNDLAIAGGFEADSYVVFGGAGVGSDAPVELSELDGSNGYVISGDDFVVSISGVSDINGDGIDDLVIGTFSDGSYLVFGGGAVGASGIIELSELDGSNGFAINGFEREFPGLAVSGAGDINADGFGDLIIGAEEESTNGYASGATFVIFGGEDVGLTSSIDVSELNGNNGFVVNGSDRFDGIGSSVSGAGDINGDGFDDLIIGAPSADPFNAEYVGQSFVVFGGEAVGVSGVLEVSELDGSNGFVLNGIDERDRSGFSVSGLGDFNGDGLDDLIIGAPDADPNRDDYVGESYVVFGNGTVGSAGAIDLSDLDGSNGFVVNGINFLEYAGIAVSGAGDINGDGFDDAAIVTNGNANGFASGQTYVLFGASDAGSSGTFELSEVDGNNGFVINGINEYDFAGNTVSGAGDINGDGVDDLFVGSFQRPGQSYVIFGMGDSSVLTCNGLAVTVNLALGQTPGPGNDVILGTASNDDIRSLGGNDTICGLGGDDLIRGGIGDDWIDGGDGKDDIRGASGDDYIEGGSGDDFIRGDRGRDVINGGAGADILTGGSGADVMNGGGGQDFLNGGLGNDLISGGNNEDTLTGGEGRDTLNGNGAADNLFGGPGSDIINGGGGDDVLRGSAGDDQLSGNAGDDLLRGGGGTDSCNGGSGTDTASLSCESTSEIP